MADDKQRIQLKRGNNANLPNTGLLAGEPLVTLDRGNVYVAIDATTTKTLTPAIDKLSTLAAVSGGDDLIMVYDHSENSGQKEKKLTVNAFRAALNIPESSTDEKVALVSGGTAGYLYGDGSDGVLRMGPSMKWDKDEGNGYATLNVNVIDGGTF